MTVLRSLLGGFVRFIWWLCYEHQWTELELSAIAGVVILLLLLVLIRLRRRPVRHIHAGQIREAMPTIGANLAEHNRRRRSSRKVKADSTARTSQMEETPKNWKQMTRQFAKSNEQIKRLQHELTIRRQSETDLEQKLADSKDANKRRIDEIAANNTIKTQLEMQIAELKTTVGQLREEISKHEQTEASLQRQVAELTSRFEQTQPDEDVTEAPEKAAKSKQLEEPLSIEELKKVSALAKRVAGRVSSDATN